MTPYRIEIDAKSVRIYQSKTEDGETAEWSIEVDRDTADLYRAAIALAYPKRVRQAGTAEQFDAFWKCYPKRVAKEAALKAWKRVNGDANIDAILSHVSAMSASTDWMKSGGAFVPYPATYLNGGYWQSEASDDIGNIL